MGSKLVLSCGLLLNVYANIDNDFLIDYFNYKQAPSVVGISCNSIEDDLLLVKDFSHNGISVTVSKLNNESGIRVLAGTDYWRIGVFLDTRCCDEEFIASVFYEASDYRMFNELRYWLILGSDLDDALQIIDDRAFGLSTDFVIAVPSIETDDQYELYDAYNLLRERGSILNVTFFGRWTVNEGLSVSLLQTKFERRTNLHNFTIKASYFHASQCVNGGTHASRDAESKFGYHLMRHLADLYNFNLVNYETPKYRPGDTQGPLARSIINNAADITGNTVSVNSNRTYLLKYVHQVWPFRTCFVFRNPQPTTIKVEEILHPFNTIIWYLMAVLVILCISILAVFFRFEGVDGTAIRISNSVLITIGALCQQGTDVKMINVSTRIAFFFIMIFSLLMYNYYSASVVSARLDEPIFKINDSLVEFGKYRLPMASEAMIYLEFFLKKTDWETKTFYQDYWLKLPESERLMESDLGMQLVQKGGFAYHTHPDIAYRYIEKHYGNREICELTEVNLARKMRNSFAVTYNSSFVEIARVGFQKISEVGLRRRQVLRWQFRKPPCRKDILSASSVNIYEFAPHLILLMIGMLIAIFFFAIEMIVVNHGAYIRSEMLLVVHRLCYHQIDTN